MSNIYDLANNLERAIRELDQYKAVQAAKAAIDADPHASEIWARFSHMQATVQMQMQTGQMPSEEDQKNMQAVAAEIESNPLLKTYFDNQQALSVYIQDVERIIFQPLQDLMK